MQDRIAVLLAFVLLVLSWLPAQLDSHPTSDFSSSTEVEGGRRTEPRVKEGEAKDSYDDNEDPTAEETNVFPAIPRETQVFTFTPIDDDYVTVPGCRALLYVSISPVRAKGLPTRLAEVHWDYENCPITPAAAAIYLGEERPFRKLVDLDPPPVWRANLTGAKGRILSNFSVPQNLPAGWARHSPSPERMRFLGEFCRQFRAVLVDTVGNHLQTGCLKIQPSWMQNMVKFQRGNLALNEMFIPGTHNSACYSREGEEGDSQMTRYLLTQDFTIWEQLVSGIRYFDLRVGYYPQDMGDQQNTSHPDHGQRFWINHDMVRIQPLRPILEDIKEFVSDDRKLGEIVILDFHRFPVGFGSSEDDKETEYDRHAELFVLLREVFGDLLIENDSAFNRKKLQDIFASGKKIVVSYGNRAFQTKENDLLHPSISQHWGNKQSLEDLVSFMEQKLRLKLENPRSPDLSALMAELTPTMFDVLLNLQRASLRNMANEVNAILTEKIRHEFWNRNINIFAVDFFESTDLIAIAIAANWKHADFKFQQQTFMATEALSTPLGPRTSLDSTVHSKFYRR